MTKERLVPTLLSRIDWRIAFRNGFGASAAWITGGAFSQLLPHPNPMISSLWTVLTAVLVLQAHLGGTYNAAWTRFLGLVLGSTIGAVIATFLGADSLTLGISIAGTVIVCSIFNLQEAYRITVATVAVIIILLPINPNVTPWEFSLYRFLDSCVGIVIAVLVAHVVFPIRAHETMRKNMARGMEKLGRLYRIAIQSETLTESQKSVTQGLIQEVDDLLYDNRKTLEDSKPELITRSARINDWTLFTAQMDDLFEQVLALHHIYKPNIKQLFDDELNHHFDEVIGKISTSFNETTKMLETENYASPLPDLSAELIQLNEELLRFRGTKKTRSFDLVDVENFFVLFYSLKSIMELLKKIEHSVNILVTDSR